DCDDGNVCNGQETCDAIAGCVVGAPPSCDSGAICAEDTCNPVYGCQSTFIPMCCVSDADCMNNTVCDGAETCVNGDCMRGTAATCDDHDACTGVETCDPTTGACLPGIPLVCGDGNPCTDDVCDPATGCAYAYNTNVCDDGNPCTTNDLCAAGICVGTPDLLCQGQTLLGLVSTANPADLGGARQQAQLQSSLQVINRKLERALTLRAHRRSRLRAAYRRLGLFQLA